MGEISNLFYVLMGVEEWANCRRGRVRESMCGMMCLTQVQPLLPPIKEERLLPTSSVQYTQERWVSRWVSDNVNWQKPALPRRTLLGDSVNIEDFL